MHLGLEQPSTIRIDAPGADIVLHTAPDLGAAPADLFEALRVSIPWERRPVVIGGVERMQPRLVSWHGEHAYTYSGLRLEPKPWTPLLLDLRDRVSALCGAPFDGVLLNAYPDGRSSIGMHSDDEREFGRDPTIASVSLGAVRRFDLARQDGSARPVRLALESGSVLVMAGATQRLWKHGIAKTTEPVGARINLTFRRIVHPRR